MNDKYSLDNLRDIVLPDPPPLWPPAPEVWLLLAIVLLAAVILIYQWRRRHQHNAYRRAGLALLQNASTVHDVSVVLKRVALAAFPRQQVASLYAEEWTVFLHKTCTGCNLSSIAQADTHAQADRKLVRQAGKWIRRHHAPGRASVDGEQ